MKSVSGYLSNAEASTCSHALSYCCAFCDCGSLTWMKVTSFPPSAVVTVPVSLHQPYFALPTRKEQVAPLFRPESRTVWRCRWKTYHMIPKKSRSIPGNCRSTSSLCCVIEKPAGSVVGVPVKVAPSPS